jgi:heme oxygenase
VDLVALGATGTAPTYEGVPELGSLAAGFGCLYVLEGSTLGGQVILRHVGSSLGLDASRGASFFASYGRRVGSMWRAFGEAASAHCATEAHCDEALAAATHTFEAFHHWIKPPGDEPSAVQEAL